MVTSLPYMGVSIVVVWLLGLSTRPNPLPFPSGVGLSKWIPYQKISSMADALLAYFSMAVGPITTEKFPILHNTEKKIRYFWSSASGSHKMCGNPWWDSCVGSILFVRAQSTTLPLSLMSSLGSTWFYLLYIQTHSYPN